jgi:chromosome segregation ATPase
VRSLEQEVQRQQRLAEKFKAASERAEHKQADVEDLRARLEHAERELSGAREHLMVIEVKLDILEGAANVLDGRMRTAAPQRTGQTGVPA